MPPTLRRIRWGLEQAATEFDIDSKTLSKRLKTAGIEPGEDGKYSTLQIARAVYGDIQGERLRETRERADKLALENQRLRAQLVPINDLRPGFLGWATSVTQKIKSSHLSDIEKGDLLNDLRSFDFEAAIRRAVQGGELPEGSGGDDEAAAQPDRKRVGRRAPRTKQRGKQSTR